ncbi:MAG: endonuclease MutS2 [Bacteroidetes bacterium]|nr:endonuclease MutS2 [Bacteroidota bacterium]
MIDNSTLEKLEFPKILTYISHYAITEPGKSRILSLTPSTDIKTVLQQGKLIIEAKNILAENFPPPLEYISDLSVELAKSKIEGTVLRVKKILDILKLAACSRLLYNFIKENSEIAPLLKQSSNWLFVDKLFEHHIQKVIDENGEVKENASKNLKEIRKSIREKKSDLIRSINKIMKDLNEQKMVMDDYLTLRDGRMVIPIKAEHKRHLKGFIHSESATGHTVYIEPEQTLELNNDIISLTFAERREIERLLKELTKMIGSVADDLKSSLDEIAEIDSIFARAHYSVEVMGSFPELNGRKHLEIRDGRHPVLLKKLGRKGTVALDLKLEDENIVVITGPNAGGKTVVLKTIGLLSALVQSGIHIPVNPDSNFPLCENILIDIGDEQSIEDDLSTFSSHLKNIKYILEQANENSLILLDEIGTGTDPSEGASLASAVLMRLRDCRATVFASTHHGSLKLIAHDEKMFVNAAMEFDNEKLTPTYKFKLGIPGSSYAFEVAKRIGIDDKLLNEAAQNIDTDKHKLEEFLVEIESKSTALEKKLKESELENTRLTGLSNLYKKNLEKLEIEKKEILKKVKIDGEKYLEGVNRKIEQVIKELRETQASKEVIKKSKELIREIKEKNENLFVPDVELEQEITDFRISDFVRLRDTSATGKIFSIDKIKKRAVVQVGTMKMKVNINELLLEKEKSSKEKRSSYNNYKIQTREYRLDIRGEKPDETEFKVIKFLDDSYASGQERIEILHGKGTGALKKTVIAILKKHDKVKDYYFAPIEAGGEGITIVELK